MESSDKFYLPYFVAGTVVKGYGRGSKQLGIPTANFSQDVIKHLPDFIENGIYYGWANVNYGPVYMMVLSVGNNPYYDNTYRSMETHILHTFPDDFYNEELCICLVGYIRPEANFNNVQQLIDAIHEDIKIAKHQLENSFHIKLKESSFFYRNKHIY